MKSQLSAIALILVPVTANAQGVTATASTDTAQTRIEIAAGRAEAANAHALTAKCLKEGQTVTEYAECWRNGSAANPTGGPLGAADGGSE